MILTETQIKEFEKIVTPLMTWIRLNGHPHITVIVDSERSEIVEGLASFLREKANPCPLVNSPKGEA